MDLIERPGGVVRRHPWELSRARFFLALLERLELLGTTDRWLDVGAGDAWFAQQLRSVLPSGARLTCWDAFYPTPQPPEWAEVFPGIEFERATARGALRRRPHARRDRARRGRRRLRPARW